MAKNKADGFRVEEGFGIRVSETSREKEVNIIDDCMIEGDKSARQM